MYSHLDRVNSRGLYERLVRRACHRLSTHTGESIARVMELVGAMFALRSRRQSLARDLLYWEQIDWKERIGKERFVKRFRAGMTEILD